MLLPGYETIAHRGLHNKKEGIPENSLPAFQRAVDAGVAIELDVHLTKDGEIVVFHDDSLKRMTGFDRIVEDCTCQELIALKLGGTEYGIPVMSRVLRLVNGRVPLLIELKDNTFSGCLAERLMALLSDYRGTYMLQSFNPYVLYWLKKHAPRVKRGQLSQRSFARERAGSEGAAGRLLAGPRQLARKKILGGMLFNGLTKPDFIAYNIHDLKPEAAKKWRKDGRGLLAWTVRTEGDLRKARWLCGGVIFERMDLSAVKEK
ncbi:glycerophosphodiester phosphodiesterase family protein [Bacilliculturomica massiliensis]|uniref:glycerophosphodiester phosphodiesterase family protein n=1 Tax=Bacilliculturomica massiliensis TaxID=1917867 RepID=UPI001031A5E3|nr:glycerophosphodiester phosphodiesterase family protein [Bacilliculturomica massiliensis]